MTLHFIVKAWKKTAGGNAQNAWSCAKQFNQWSVKCFLKVDRRLPGWEFLQVFFSFSPERLWCLISWFCFKFLVQAVVPLRDKKAEGEQIFLLFSLSLFETLGNVPWIDMRGKMVALDRFQTSHQLNLFCVKLGIANSAMVLVSDQTNKLNSYLKLSKQSLGEICHRSKNVQYWNEAWIQSMKLVSQHVQVLYFPHYRAQRYWLVYLHAFSAYKLYWTIRRIEQNKTAK